MNFLHYMTSKENDVNHIITDLLKNNINKVKSLALQSCKQLIEVIKQQNKEHEFINIINKAFKTKFNNINDLLNKNISEDENYYIDEDLKHFTSWSKEQLFPAVSIFPTLQIWFEIDHLIDGQSPNFKKIIIYSVFWILLLTGKHISMWNNWKKQNPEEFKKENKPGPFSKR